MRPRFPAAALLALCIAVPVVFTACRHGGGIAASVPPVATPADDNLNAVLWVQTSDEYRMAAAQAWQAASVKLDRALADPDWDALLPSERANPAAGLKPAVIVDIDETVLDNSPYQARLVRDGGSFDPASWAAWVDEQKARPVPGAVEFARAAADKGVTMIYLSNREQAQAAPTLANLRAVGFPVAGDHVFLGMGTEVEGCEQPRASHKHCRRQLAGRQYRVLMMFGDQLGDFIEAPAGPAGDRTVLLDAYRGWFGERWWMLPNPTYGSWESAASGNDRDLSPQARKAAKRAALDVAP